MKNSFNFITQYYFPSRFIWALVSGLAAVAFFAVQYYLVSVTSLLLGVIALTTRYGVEINFSAKQYLEYTWMLGFKAGVRINFESVRYLFIKDFKISQTFNSRVNSATITHEEYRGYVKFNEREKVHIMSKKDYHLLVNELKELARKFNVGLVDYSFGHLVKLV